MTNSEILELLKTRFLNNMNRHPEVLWNDVYAKLINNPSQIETLIKMEKTGGEPDVIDYIESSNMFMFVDCSQESPSGRRSLCYDKNALDSRKENKPSNDAMSLAEEIGIELLDETLYRKLQSIGKFDLKSSSWIKTPDEIRKLGGAIFAEFRYDNVFIFHNSAQSYYAVRGFRGVLLV